MDIGRVDLAHSLKQYFELAGQMHLSLGEGIVPGAIVADLNRTPFSLDLPFMGYTRQPAVAAEYSYIVIRPTGLPVNSWVTIDRVVTLALAGIPIVIEPYALASVPALTAGGVVQAMRRARIDGGQPGLPEVDFLRGSSATIPTLLGWEIAESTISTRITEGPWHITAGGALVIANTSLNSLVSAGVYGRVHFTSAK